MVGFGGVEFFGGGYFGFDLVAFLFEELDQFFGDLFLIFILIEDGGAVLGADIGSLAV